MHVALPADYLSSLANDSYLGVTDHTIDHSWTLHSFALAVYYVEDSHYFTLCAQKFTIVANSWGIYDKVTTLATDNARKVTAAVTMLPFEHMPLCSSQSSVISQEGT